MTATLNVERSGRIARVTLNRPAALNALDFEMMDALVTCMTTLASFAQCAATSDFAEGVRAFIAKREPRFGD